MGLFILEANVTRRDVAEQIRECLTNAEITQRFAPQNGRPGMYAVAGRVINFALFEKLMTIAQNEQPSIGTFNLSKIIAEYTAPR